MEAREKGLGQGYGAEILTRLLTPSPTPAQWVAALLTLQAQCSDYVPGAENGKETDRLALFVYSHSFTCFLGGSPRDDRGGGFSLRSCCGAADEARASFGSSDRFRLTLPWKVLLRKWPW